MAEWLAFPTRSWGTQFSQSLWMVRWFSPGSPVFALLWWTIGSLCEIFLNPKSKLNQWNSDSWLYSASLHGAINYHLSIVSVIHCLNNPLSQYDLNNVDRDVKCTKSSWNIYQQNENWPWFHLFTSSIMKKGSGQFLARECAQVLVNHNPCPAEYIKMPRLLLIFSQSYYLIQVIDTNSNTEWQTVQIQICSEANWSGSALFAKAGHIRVPGSAGQGWRGLSLPRKTVVRQANRLNITLKVLTGT